MFIQDGLAITKMTSFYFCRHKCSVTDSVSCHWNPDDDDVIKWKHFPSNWPLVREIHQWQWPVDSSPVTRSSDVRFDLHKNKLLCKQPRRRWFWDAITPLWRHCKVMRYERCLEMGCAYPEVQNSILRILDWDKHDKCVASPCNPRALQCREVVILITFGADNDENLIKMTFPFRWRVIQPDWFDTPADKHDGANAWINYTHEHHSISNNPQLDCLFSSLLENKSPKENIKAPCHGALCVHGFPSQRASNTERVSMLWRHHVCSFLSKNVSQISRHIYFQVEPFTFLMTYACTVSMVLWVYKARSCFGILFWRIHQILLQVT